jgi:hypothetical protein
LSTRIDAGISSQLARARPGATSFVRRVAHTLLPDVRANDQEESRCTGPNYWQRSPSDHFVVHDVRRLRAHRAHEHVRHECPQSLRIPGLLQRSATRIRELAVPEPFSSGEHLGVIRATAVSPVIKRVVFATPSGGSRARTIQYNTPSRWCLAPFPGP